MTTNRKPADTGLLYGTAIIGTVALYLALGAIWNAEMERRAVRSQVRFDAVMASLKQPEPVTVVSKPVHLYKSAKLSKSAAAVAKANDVALLAVFDAGRAGQ